MLFHFKKSNDFLETWSPHCKNLAFQDPPSLNFDNRPDAIIGVLEFSQKTENEFVVEVKTNQFVRFLGEFEDTKSPFEIICPLQEIRKVWEVKKVKEVQRPERSVSSSLDEWVGLCGNMKNPIVCIKFMKTFQVEVWLHLVFVLF